MIYASEQFYPTKAGVRVIRLSDKPSVLFRVHVLEETAAATPSMLNP